VSRAEHADRSGKLHAPDAAQEQELRAVAQLAPSNAREIAAWTLLCMLVGVVEEIVFRGYLQRQFIAWSRGQVAAGVALSALMFGAAHAYQGLRNMVLLGVFGALFSLLALYRRSLRAGMFAHGWHDLIAGLALALLKSQHII
jgi:membrane protease YdiL (CAAX protease family)